MLVYDELRNLLIGASSVEMVQMFDDSFNLFERFELEDPLGAYDLVIGNNTDASAETVCEGLISTLSDQLDALLNEFGIHVNDECPIRKKIEFAQVVDLIDGWLDKEGVLKALSCDESDEEVFAYVCQAILSGEMEDYFVYLTSVSGELLTRIEQITQQSYIEDLPDFDRIAKEFKLLKDVCMRQDFWAMTLIQNTGNCKIDFLTLAQIYFVQIAEFFDTPNEQQIKDIALNLVAISIISTDTMAACIEKSAAFFSQHHAHILVSTKITMQINKLLAEMRNVANAIPA